MPPILLLLVGVGVAAAILSSRKDGEGPAEKALPPVDSGVGVDPRQLENLLIIIAAGQKRPGDLERAADMAQNLGMPVTAKGLREGAKAGLPMGELWPATNEPVAIYIAKAIKVRKEAAKQADARKKALAAQSAAKGTYAAYQGIKSLLGKS